MWETLAQPLPPPKGSCRLSLLSQLHLLKLSLFLYGVQKYLLGQVSVILWSRGHHSSAKVEKLFPILSPVITEYQILKWSLQHIPCHQDFLICV